MHPPQRDGSPLPVVAIARLPACPFTSRSQATVIEFGVLSSQQPSPAFTSWNKVTQGYRNSPHVCNAAISIEASSPIPSGTTIKPWRPYNPVSGFFQVCCHTSRRCPALGAHYHYSACFLSGLLAPECWCPRSLRSLSVPYPLFIIAHLCGPLLGIAAIFILPLILPFPILTRSLSLCHSPCPNYWERLFAQHFRQSPFEMSDGLLMNVCSVGGNPVSAFLSWRLQATNACDVTLVWKSGYEHVAQYGISFK